MAKKFRTPDKYPKKKARVPISARLDKEIKSSLEKVAKKEGLSFGELIEYVLEDYNDFLNSSKRGKQR